MSDVPGYLTRYYKRNENPFISLNDFPLEQANRIKRLHCQQDGIGGFYAEDDYLVHRLEIEKWIYNQLLLKGGAPKESVPIYMILGDSPTGQFDIRADLQKNASELRIPIEVLDLSAVTFTFPDSMYKIILDDNGNIIDTSTILKHRCGIEKCYIDFMILIKQKCYNQNHSYPIV